MPLTLRQHLSNALEILSTGGVRTLLPKVGGGSSGKVSAGNPALEYATTVKMVVERHDSSGLAFAYLASSDEAASEIARRATEEVWRRAQKDMRRMRKQLRKGGYAVGLG